jgi:endonuclease/exonuclease/phosphatase family metal-dependent hydrolase
LNFELFVRYTYRMTIKLLQLNTNSDNYWEKLVSYLTSNNFDVIHLQELTGDHTIAGNINSHRNTYAQLQKILQDKYYGVLSVTQRYTSSPDAYMGNAIFYKKNFILKDKKEVILSKFDVFSSESTTYENVGRTLLHLTFTIERKQISFLNTHLAWARTPREEPHQSRQGAILLHYLQTVNPPFVLSGDFNLTPDQPLIKKISKLAVNLTTKNHITNTLDPANHRVKEIFPEGFAVDYIFTSNDVHVKKFAVVEKELSDHFGLKVAIEI